MSTYCAYIVDDGSGNFGVVAFRAPATAPAGGTRLTIPWITNNNAGNEYFVISAATTATPIAITTSASHNWVTGDTIEIEANSSTDPTLNIEGTFQFTKTGAATGTLDGTVGSGTYVASSASGKKLTTAKDPITALQAASRAIADDRASGN
jgi:hypothetical protein